MRILHILDHSIPLHSGYTFRTRAILNQQHALGWETFHLTSPKQGNVESLKEDVDGLTFYRTPVLNGWASKLAVGKQFAIIPALTKRMVEVVEEIRPDVIHAHSPSLNGLAALKVARQFNLPLVYEIRAFWEDAAVDHGTSKEWGLRYRLTRSSETMVLKNANAVTTICQGLRNEMMTRGIPEEKITVIPNAVNIEQFPVSSGYDEVLKESLGLSGKRVLGFLGSFYAYEGLSLLINALPDIIKANNNVSVLLVGGGPQEQNLKQLVIDLGLQDRVIFTGRVPHEQVNRYYDLVDILVYPRLSMRLTDLVTPLKPLEAMAQHKLVLASDVGGHKELISDGETGYLFDSDNPKALAEKVLHVLANENEWDAIKENGRRHVEDERNWKVSVARYQGVYDRAIGNKKVN